MKLTKEQADLIIKEMDEPGERVPVRFLYNRKSLDITTGELTGGNVIYHIHYYGFTKKLSAKIAKMLGAKAVYLR